MDAPEDFVAFVARHEPDVRSAAEEVTGSDNAVRQLRHEVFTAVAARWEWLSPRGRWARLRPGPASRWPRPLRRRPDPAGQYLRQAVTRSRVRWRDELPDDAGLEWEVLGSDKQHYLREPPSQAAPESVAGHAWEDGLRVRRRHNLMLRGGAAALILLAVLLPRGDHEPYVVVQPDPIAAPDLPMDLPPNVLLLPLSSTLNQLAARPTLLPEVIDLYPAATTALADSPLPRVVAVARDGLGPLILVAADGATRRVDAADLERGRLLTTSVSPDGQRVVLVGDPFLVVINTGTGAVSKVRGPVDSQPAQPRLIWRGNRTVMVPGGVGATMINVDTGALSFDNGTSVLHVVVAQGPAKAAYLIELVPVEGSSTGGRVRTRPSPPPTGATRSPGRVDLLPISAPTWLGHWIGQGWSNGSYYIRPCEPRNLPLPLDVGTAQDPVGVIDSRGLAVRTLTAVEQGVTLDILGWLDADEVLLRAAKGPGSWLLSWNPTTEDLTLAARVKGQGRIAVADLYEQSGRTG